MQLTYRKTRSQHCHTPAGNTLSPPRSNAKIDRGGQTPSGCVTSGSSSCNNSPPPDSRGVSLHGGQVAQEVTTDSQSDARGPASSQFRQEEITTESQPSSDNLNRRRQIQTEPTRKRKYLKRRRGQAGKHSKVPSVQVQGLLTDDSFFICEKAASFFLGVGPRQVQRAFSGIPDGRSRQARPCRQANTSTRSTCFRFLWRKYHFDAESVGSYKFEAVGMKLSRVVQGHVLEQGL